MLGQPLAPPLRDVEPRQVVLLYLINQPDKRRVRRVVDVSRFNVSIRRLSAAISSSVRRSASIATCLFTVLPGDLVSKAIQVVFAHQRRMHLPIGLVREPGKQPRRAAN